MAVLVLCPSRGRPSAAIETLTSFRATRRDPQSRIVFLVDRDDPTLRGYPLGHTHVLEPKGSMGGALRSVTADVLGDATSVGMVGDDNRFETPGWDLIFDEWLTANVGIAYGDDGYQHERLPTSWWLSRPIVDEMGMCHPGQRHFYMDNYWRDLGKAVGCLRYFPEVRIEHLHPLWDAELGGRSERLSSRWDATYERGHRFVAHDKAWYKAWQGSGLRADARRLNRIVRADSPRRVFADWHHPALWESLSILLEDRFGWELYSPIGPEWKTNGWSLKNGTPGWSFDDYLVHPAAVDRDGHYELTEPEYPERVRKLVTVDQFESQRWDIILASVGPHQRPFANLAKRKGALFVHHIGDAKRHVDRGLRGVVIASANVRGAHAVHHQEFDRDVFRFVPAGEPQAVSSFMLRLEDTSGPHEWLSEAPDVHWWACQSKAMRDEHYLAPMSSVARQMQLSGWIWHDKAGYRGAASGDGYGHVLFTAAAMGRPLIGHASYYRGQMGEPLWEDGVTCIDLDRHRPDEALALWRNISGDRNQYEEMSSNIFVRFNEVVDFDAEAEAIRAVLA